MPAAASEVEDFDAWYDDTVKPYRFKLLGKTWTLPGAAPAVVVLRYQRLTGFIVASDLPDDATAEDLPEDLQGVDLTYESICRTLAGEEIVDQWFEDGLTEPHLEHVAQRLYDRYVLGVTSGKEPAAPQDRKPPAKKTAAKRTPVKKTTPSRRT